PRPEAVSVRCRFMLNAELNMSGTSTAELDVVMVAPGIRTGDEPPSRACEVPSGAAASVTLPVPPVMTEDGITLQEYEKLIISARTRPSPASSRTVVRASRRTIRGVIVWVSFFWMKGIFARTGRPNEVSERDPTGG